MSMHTITKKYQDIPMGHRIHTHPRCGKIHGHDWAFEFTFGRPMDPKEGEFNHHGFVFDFGDLKWLKALVESFDHALLLSKDDPLYRYLKSHPELAALGFDNVIPFNRPRATCEYVADYLRERVQDLILEHDLTSLLRLEKVVVWEGSKNHYTLTLVP